MTFRYGEGVEKLARADATSVNWSAKTGLLDGSAAIRSWDVKVVKCAKEQSPLDGMLLGSSDA